MGTIAISTAKGRKTLIGSALTGNGGKKMDNRGKVIKGLETCKTMHGNCHDCPYDDDSMNFAGCSSKLCGDALKLLKEQEDKIKQLRRQLDEAMLWR